jgi:hypothetical protein
MKLTKKQLSASYVTKATAATVGIHTGDVANHRDSRLDRCSVASPEGMEMSSTIGCQQYGWLMGSG